MKIKRLSEQSSSAGLSDYFTGSVRIDSAFQQNLPGTTGGALVTFEPMARTHWHSHPHGQTLVVTQGIGYVQFEGEPVQAIRPGDIVYIDADEKHWHGASETQAMSHFAIAESVNGSPVTWLEPVTNDHYFALNK